MDRIELDFKNTAGKIKYMNAVNNGPVGKGVRDSYTNFHTYKDAHISYARNHDASFYTPYGGEHTVDVHRIFRNFDADENDPASYIFEPTDKYLLNICEVGTKVYYRLGASIEHGYKFGTYPPKDFAKWARICEHIIMHYNEGWANGYNLDIEYWEIWNEPDGINPDGISATWQGTPEQFVDLYSVTAKHLKERFPYIKIGGPAFTSSYCHDYIVKFLSSLRDNNTPLDFFSFHLYSHRVEEFSEATNHAKKYLDEYGFANTELHLNEWNYVRGWLGEEWNYSLRTEKNLKGSSFIAGVMADCQDSPLDMLMYYDARPCGMNGMFENETFRPLKGYYPFVMFHELLKLGTHVKTDKVNNIFSCAATDKKNGAIMLTHYSDDDSTKPTDVSIRCTNFNSSSVRAEYYLLDEDNDMKMIRSETFTASEFIINLNMKIHSTYLVKFISLS